MIASCVRSINRFRPNRIPRFARCSAQILKQASGIDGYSIDTEQQAIRVRIGDNEHALPYEWIIDHSETNDSLHPTTQQRKINVFRLTESSCVKPMHVSVEKGGEWLDVRWNNKLRSAISFRLLKHVTSPSNANAYIRYPLQHFTNAVRSSARGYTNEDIAEAPSCWTAEEYQHPSVRNLPVLQMDQIIKTDAGLLEMLCTIRTHGFCLIQGEEIPHKLLQFTHRIGPPRSSIFGSTWDFTIDTGKSEALPHNDTAYTNDDIEPHTDGTYSSLQPGLQFFNIIHYHGEGGGNSLVDGFRVAQDIRKEHPEVFDFLTSFPVPAQYREPTMHYFAQKPVITLNASGSPRLISFNNHDRAPFYAPDTPVIRFFYKAYGIFHKYINSPKYQLNILLKPNLMLVTNNWRILHGRQHFTGKRRLVGAYMNMEDYEGRLRSMLPLQFNAHYREPEVSKAHT